MNAIDQGEPTVSVHPAPGATLAAAREALGYSVVDVAGQMKLAPRQVEALEADRYGDLPGPVFVRGFLKNYARLLHLDPVPLLAQVDARLGSEAPLTVRSTGGEIPYPTGRRRTWPIYLAVLAVVLLAAASYELLFNRPVAIEKVVAVKPTSEGAETVVDAGSPAPPDAPGAVSAAPAAAGTTELSPAPAQVLSSAAVAGSAPTAATQAAVPAPGGESRGAPATGGVPSDAVATAGTTASGAAPPAPSAEATGRAPEATAGGPVEGVVRMRFSRDSWVEVRDRDGKVLASTTYPAGARRTFEGAAPFSLVIGNTAGVELTFNGAPVDLDARSKAGVARFTLE